MKGIIRKDILVLWNYSKIFFLLILGFAFMSAFVIDNAFLWIYPIMLSSLWGISLIGYEENEHWDIYSGTLPLTDRQIVGEKYLFCAGSSAATIIICTAARTFGMISRGVFSFPELIMMVSTLVMVGLIGPTITLPLIFRFGMERGRIGYFIVMALVYIALMILGELIGGDGILQINSKLALISDFLPIIIIFVSLLLYLCSYNISITAYKKHSR